jgi:hypothetical protein
MTLITERRGRVVNTPNSYFGGPGFDSRPRWPAILIEVFVIFLSPSRRMLGQYLKIRPRQLSTKSFPIRRHSLILSSSLCSLVTEKRREINYQPDIAWNILKWLRLQRSADNLKPGASLAAKAVRLALPYTFYYGLGNVLRVCLLDLAAGEHEILG